MESRATEKSLRLVVEVPPEPPHLVGDPTRLRQALLNFVSNAIKFTDSGSVTLRLGIAADSAEDVLLRFEVEDTGPGIAPTVLASLFNTFEQGDNTTTRKHGGTGLGLVIARRLAQLMGGDAGATSTPGVGSVFWFTARLKKVVGPAAQPEPEADNFEALLVGALQGAHVLLAEDDPVNQEIARELLGELGLSVDVASDGAEAVRMAAASDYALILMDMQMPKMDGLAATRAIRQLPRFLAVQRLPRRLARGHGRGGQVTLSARDFLRRHQRIAAPGVQVDADGVAALQPTQPSAHGAFGRCVEDGRAVCRARLAPVAQRW